MKPSSPIASLLSRRRFLAGAAALPWLAGCSTPLPLDVARSGTDPAARALVLASAEAHGLAAFRSVRDINIGYDGKWRPLIDGIQPEVVDAGFRGSSQERLMPAAGRVSQAYTGEEGRKQVVWRRSAATAAPAVDSSQAARIAVWTNGTAANDPLALDAAALVAEGYGFFLLGPLWLASRDPTLSQPMRLAGTESVDGRICDVVELWLNPGLGRTAQDRLALCIDRTDGLTRRLRFTLEGFVNTQGAVAEVDTYDHARRFGIVWPMRSFERVLHPIALPAHDWHVTGLDINRGYDASAIDGPRFTGAALGDAARL